VALNSTLAGG